MLREQNQDEEGARTRGHSPLTITRIETIPVRAPLAADFKGSHYHMTHRSTIITRVYTADGIVGEATPATRTQLAGD